jgi:chromosomal replication initiator protein DnaA
MVKQEEVASCLVKQCKIPHLSLLDYDVGSDVLDLIPREICEKHHLLPIDKLGRILTVAMVDPLDIEALEAVRNSCPELRIKPILCNWEHFETVLAKTFGGAKHVKGAEETAESFGLSAARPGTVRAAVTPTPPNPAPASPAPAATPTAAPPASPAASGPNAEALVHLLRDGMREAMQEAVRAMAQQAVPPPQAAAPAGGFDSAELANILRGAMQESVASIAQELRATAPAPVSVAAPAPVEANQTAILADAIRESVGGAMQEAMAMLLVQLRSSLPSAEHTPAAPAPDATMLAEMIRDSVGGALQEVMATMVVQMRSIAGKHEGGSEDSAARVADAVREALGQVQQVHQQQESKLAQIAEAMLQSVQQTSQLVESKIVSDHTHRDLRQGGRHASVTPFRDMQQGGALAGGNEEADLRVRDAMESEHPLETLTLDNFFPGKANAFTFTLSKAVTENPGGEYNPYFLYGHVGVGKTHLISAIGNTILARQGNQRVGYVSASHFARRLADAVKEGALEAFRENYSHWDVLILDDIQFMGGKVEAQEEFFHIFNVLRQQGRQIIIASDKAPDRLGLLEQRLISRFGSGIVAELKVPEYETRMQILRHSVQESGVKVPDEVLGLIAMRVAHDVRKMMGSLRKVTAFAKLVGQDMSVEMANEILSHLGFEEAA